MIGWLLTAALAAPPEGLDLFDTAPWAEAARRFDDGPDGCWDLEGRYTLRFLQDTGASFFGRAERTDEGIAGDVRARFVDHEWTTFHYQLPGEREDWMLVFPFWGDVGKGAVKAVDQDWEPIPEDPRAIRRRERAQARAERAQARKGDDAEEESSVRYTAIESLEWDEEAQAVRFVENAVIEGIGRGKLDVAHTFPRGERVATAVDFELPETFQIGTWPLAGTVREGRAHVRGFAVGDSVLPQAQRFSALVTAFGQTIGLDLGLSFHEARPCTSEVPSDPPTPEPATSTP